LPTLYLYEHVYSHKAEQRERNKFVLLTVTVINLLKQLPNIGGMNTVRSILSLM